MPGKVSLLRSFLLLSLALALIRTPVHPQQDNLLFETFSVEQGVPTAVTCILQDRTGYLWFGTHSGLHRYDGYNFVSYRHDPDDPSTIVDNNAFTMYEDKAGVLWIGSPCGLDRYDRTTGTFSHYAPYPPGTTKDPGNGVWAIREDRNGVLWVGTAWGLHQFNRMTGEFTALQNDSTGAGYTSRNAINAICEDKEERLWFATREGLDRYDFESGEFIHCWNDSGNRQRPWVDTSMYCINSLCADESGTLWMGTNGGLVEFNPREGTYSRYRYNPPKGINSIYGICQDAMTGSLWIATGRELLSFSRQSKAFAHYDYLAYAICSERSGTLWVGTDTYIRKLNRARQPFKKYPMNSAALVIKSGKDGILWIKIHNGYRKFDIRREVLIPFSFGKDSVLFVYNSGGDVLLYSENDLVSTVDSSGARHVWEPCSREFANSVCHSWKGSRGYWFGTAFGGIYLVEFKKPRFREIRNVKLQIDFIYEDASGLVWVATATGKLFCYDQEEDTIAEFMPEPKNPSTTSGRGVRDILEDSKGDLWFAANDGLLRLDRSAKKFVRYSEKDGLPSNNVRGVLEDDHGCLWIATNKGISKFDPETNHIKNYDASYGLEPTADVFFGKGCKTRNGEMYFGGAGGFTRFHPDSVKDNPFVPPVVITSFRKFDKPCPLPRDIRLPYDENFIAFEFAALSYVSPDRNRYAFKMEGLDKDWVQSGRRRYASYPGLEPGEYTFRVKGSNNDGVWNEVGTSVSIVISPPWWKTTWAYALYSLMVLSALYVTWKMQVKRIRMGHEYEMSRFEAERLHEMDGMKSRFFASISHEFRTPLTLILGPVNQIIERTEEEDTRRGLQVVHRNANRLLALVNQLLDLSRLESGAMKLQTVRMNIVPLLKALTLSFVSFAERKRITLTFDAQEADIPAFVDKDKIEKIITNVLSNAFKFTPECGKIDVSLTRTGQRVTIAVADTGIGIPADKMPRIFDRFYQVDGSHTREQEGSGIGLSLTKELVELHKGTIEVESVQEKGTTFVICIPLGRGHLKPEEIREVEGDGEMRNLVAGATSSLPEEMISREATKAGKPEIAVITETEKPLLLIVEDNPDVSEYIQNDLMPEYRILEAADGEDGWRKSVEHMPDVVVSDVMMPKMDGFSLCDQIKKDERTSHIPVILLTAKASQQDRIEGLETGADDYIMKPFEPAELNARIHNLIEQRKRIHEHFRRHGLYEIEDKSITPVDQKFLQNALAVITRHMSDATFGVASLAAELAVSRSVLLKKIEALVGEPPQELIKRTRLITAAKLIERRFGNMSQIALEVGFNNPSYFSKSFKNQFGSSPSHYLRNSALK